MDDVQASKLMSRVLRHEPSMVGLELGPAGWIGVDDLVEALATCGYRVSRQQLERVVASSNKQRFSIDASTDQIRANQGHTVDVELGLAPATPPDVLFHGTPTRNLVSIPTAGLDRRARHAVHLSPDASTADRVGARRGKHVVLRVDAAGMHRDGFVFSVSANGVWLVDRVPPRYVQVVPSAAGTGNPDRVTDDDGWPYFGDSDDDENPWWDLRTGGEHQRRTALSHASELRAELASVHPLYGLGFEVIARYKPADDVLIKLADGRWALVHLTWNFRHHPEGSAVGSVDISYEDRGSSGRMLLCRRGIRRSSSVTWLRSPVGVI